MLLDLCKNCGRDYKYSGGRCNACRLYYTRYGIERPKRLWWDRPKPIRVCKNCNSARDITGGRCKTCYEYRRHTGIERPEHLYNSPYRCINCQQVLRSSRKSLGRCPTCASYWRYHGRKKERPSEYWQYEQ